MTTIVPFAPVIAPGSPPFQFQATLDGNLYNCVVTWNAASQVWYVGVYDLSGNLIVLQPMVGSSNPRPLASLTWQSWGGGLVEAAAATPLWLPLGLVTLFSISSAVPFGYNVLAPCTIVGPSAFTYPLSANPGPTTNAGAYSFDVNLLKGYFASTLVWRILNGNIEINP